MTIVGPRPERPSIAAEYEKVIPEFHLRLQATLMITGGTGSFGSTVLKHFLDSDLKEIRIFSRDEKKQDDMRHELQAKHPENAKKVKFYIGDVRNPQSVRDAMPGVDYIFHAAALKQVPSCEFFPMQAVQTNVIGTGLGIAEFDDVFGNTVGGWIGMVAAYVVANQKFETHNSCS